MRVPGIQGAKGEDGITPDIDVKAETLPAGSPAQVSKSGSLENPLFTFGIPQGEKGDKGDNGEISDLDVIDNNVIDNLFGA